MLLLETGRDGLHDLVSLASVIDGVRVEVAGRAELQLGDTSLSVLLDCDLIGLGEALLLPPHHLDEFFQIFDFLGLSTPSHSRVSTRSLAKASDAPLGPGSPETLTIAFLVPLINIISFP